jgi:hypothetical protein
MLVLLGTEGMDRLCKYRYKGDRCAHGLINSTACVGEDSCSHADVARRHLYHDDCSREHWYGLYCAKYQRFYCAGKDNCTSVEDYFGSWVKFRTGVD